MEFFSTAAALAGPLARLVSSISGLGPEDRDRVARRLEDISNCAAKIAQELKTDIDADVLQLSGDLEFYADSLSGTLAELSPTSDTDTDVISARLSTIVERLKASYEKDQANGAIERASVRRELDVLAGRFRTQAKVIREQPLKRLGADTFRSLKKGTVGATGTAVASAAAVVAWFSDLSVDDLKDNAMKAWSFVARKERPAAGDETEIG